MAGAPKGNVNAANGHQWRDAIHRALVRFTPRDLDIVGTFKQGEALHFIAMGLVRKAIIGDKDAITEIGNRLDGKAKQAIDIAGEDTELALALFTHAAELRARLLPPQEQLGRDITAESTRE
jgi:hypothetical protein